MRGLYHLRGWEGFSCVTPHAPHSSRAVTFTHLAAFRCLSVSTHSRNLQRTDCSVPPWRVLQYFEHSAYLCTALCDAGLHLVFHRCALPAWLITARFLYVSCSILFKHDSKPTGMTLWDEALLINLQRCNSFWLIDPISLKSSLERLGDWGAVLFLWQAERPSETKTLRQRFNSPFRCQFIWPRLTLSGLREKGGEKKQFVWMSLKHILHRSRYKWGFFLATKCFFFHQQSTLIRAPESLVKMRQTFVRSCSCWEAFVRLFLCTDALRSQNTNKQESAGQPWVAWMF